MQGESTVYYASGKVEKRLYEKGELNGPATITWPSGDVFEFSYNAGKMEVRNRYYYFQISYGNKYNNCLTNTER